MVPLTLFIVVTLLTFIVGCFVVGSVIVEARRDGRPLLPEDPRPEPTPAPAKVDSAPRPRSAGIMVAAVRDRHAEA
ncbi:MAG: hypothetical protein IPK37_01025 [Austwickia sp.]|jgi:hypothetical protein|nr:MAG: hypothetical protein IPK37_01025 [Austwickia sp.]